MFTMGEHHCVAYASSLAYDAARMRTTLTLEEDAIELARRLARRRGLTLGQAVSELVRRGARQPVVTADRQGLTVVQLPKGSPRVTADLVDKLVEEPP